MYTSLKSMSRTAQNMHCLCGESDAALVELDSDLTMLMHSFAFKEEHRVTISSTDQAPQRRQHCAHCVSCQSNFSFSLAACLCHYMQSCRTIRLHNHTKTPACIHAASPGPRKGASQFLCCSVVAVSSGCRLSHCVAVAHLRGHLTVSWLCSRLR